MEDDLQDEDSNTMLEKDSVQDQKSSGATVTNEKTNSDSEQRHVSEKVSQH